MITFYISETQNVNSIRESEAMQAKSLSAAKRQASRKQCFSGTVMKIEDECGRLIAYKQQGKWTDA